jgi:prolyl-tRNA editing enzyme YbaK/EbsC (Cys-tRNA(Pro) deacylase)
VHPKTAWVVEWARQRGFLVEVQEYPEGTRTAQDAAAAVGVPVGAIVKSLIFLADDEPVLALVSGAHRCSEAALARASGAGQVRRASAAEALEHSGFVIGGTPPFGHPRRFRTFLDRSLLTYDLVYAAAGTPTAVFPIPPDTLRTLTEAQVADLGG